MISVDNAEKILVESARMNPGPWYQHSKNVGLAAHLITKKVKDYDPDIAYSLGLLHDIGRRFGRTHIKHVYDGYKYFEKTDRLTSEICLTHTFPNRITEEYQGEIDISKKELEELKDRLNKTEYNYYHYLIILCDGYGFVNGFTSLEKRWIDAALRLGINEYTINKWKKMYLIRNQINNDYNINIDEILEI